VSHFLVILEPGEDYEIEHEPNCAQIETYELPEGGHIMEWDCLVGRMVSYAGLEDNGIEWKGMAKGRYEIAAYEHPASGMGWYDDYESWLEVVAADG